MGLKADGWRLDIARYPLRFTIPTRYGDLDSNAHLNNVAIAQLVEEARVRFHYHLRMLGGDISPGGVMVAHLSIDYLGEGEYPAGAEAGVGVVHVGGSSYRIGIGLFQNGRAFALAESVMVQVAGDQPRAAPLTADQRRRLEGCAAPRRI